MDNLQLKQVPVVKTGMLICKPFTEVFKAFISPDINVKFWFNQSRAARAGKQVQ